MNCFTALNELHSLSCVAERKVLRNSSPLEVMIMDLRNVQVQSIEVLSILSEIEVDLIRLYRRLYKSGHESYKQKMLNEIAEHIRTKEALKGAYAARNRTVKYLNQYLAENATNDEATSTVDPEEYEGDYVGEPRVVERGTKHSDSSD
jgi:uncharacterized protein (UPF0210 family)